VERYEAQFGEQSELGFGAPAYEFAMLAGELFNDSGAKMSGDEIVAKLTAVKSREGKAGWVYKFTASPEAGMEFSFPVGIKKIVGDRGIAVK
jgi:hypothetical protein